MCNLQLDITQRDWLRNSGWDRDKENMILVHGYAGGEDGLPMSVLRDGKFAHLNRHHFPPTNPSENLILFYVFFFQIFNCDFAFWAAALQKLM